MKKLQLIISVIIGLTTVIGIVFSAENYFAKEKAVQQLELRIDQKIVQDQYKEVRNRIWMLEDRYGDCSKMPQDVKEEYRKLIEENKIQEKQLEIILEKDK